MNSFGLASCPRLPVFLTDVQEGRGRVLALLVAGVVLSLAALAGLTVTTGTAEASFPGTNGRIACSGPLGPNPPPAGQSFLEIFTMDDSGAMANGAPTSQIRLQNNTNSDFNPRYSADGTKIAFIKDNLNNGNNNVWTMNADGTNEQQLTTTGAESFVGGWSPDGSKIVFQSSRDDNFEVYVMNADGTGQTNLTNNATAGRNSDSQPSWSPDGTKIAFQSNRLGNPNIHTMNADGTGVKALTADSLAEESAPEFSPDGQQIAFQSDRGFVPRTTGRNLEIYRMNGADGSNVVRLTFNDFKPAATGTTTTSNLTGFDLNPHWSPDGGQIVFHSGRNDAFQRAQWDVFTINSATGESPTMGAPAKQLTNRNFNDERCGWSVATPFPLLSVTKAGSGEGTVTSAPAGIDCGSDCAQGFASGTSVTLTAAPAANGSTFDGFTGGGCTGTATTCTVTVDQAKTVTANFSDPNPALTVTKTGTGQGTVTSSPTGIDCGADCKEEYSSGTSVTLTASPTEGSTFSGFNGGGCSGTATTCTVTVDQAKTVTATFGGPKLTVTNAGDGQGTVTSNPLGINCGTSTFSPKDCDEDYAAGTMVTLTASFSTSTVAGGTGSTFAGFTGGGCPATTATTCTVTMDQAKNVTATFVDNPTLTVTKAGNGSGTVTSTPTGLNCGTTCTRDFPKGSSVTLTAALAAGSDFTGFTGCNATPTATTCTVTADAAKTVTATFATKPAPAAPAPTPAPSPPSGSGDDLTLPAGNSPGVKATGRTASGGLVIVGTSGDDTIVGTDKGDQITGLGGKDSIKGQGGSDKIDGGSGSDRISGGTGNDTITGAAGNDRVSGGPGTDRLSGGSGNDVIGGGSGKDRISGGAGKDRLSGDSGNDVIGGGSGNDRISGGSGNDVVSGGSGKDPISGGAGNDRLSGGSGGDSLRGDSGNDRLSGNSGRDKLSGGSGKNVVKQ